MEQQEGQQEQEQPQPQQQQQQPEAQEGVEGPLLRTPTQCLLHAATIGDLPYLQQHLETSKHKGGKAPEGNCASVPLSLPPSRPPPSLSPLLAAAAAHGQETCVTYLLERGASVEDGDEGGTFLFPSLPPSLLLSLLQAPGVDGARALADLLRGDGLPALISLKLGLNKNIGDEGAVALAGGLCEAPRTMLKNINLRVGMGDVGMAALASVIEHGRMGQLKYINLGDGMTDKGLVALA